jgi:hypothetical protein
LKKKENSMRDYMVDIETFGTRPGSAILSIGAVAFDAETGEFGEDFYIAIEPKSNEAVGLTVDVSTIEWWMAQSDDARSAAFAGVVTVDVALSLLATSFRRCEPTRLWAKPPSFDLVLLEAAFRAVDQEIPWSFRINRDCRTLFDLTGAVQPGIGTAHNALDDAKSQALGVIDGYRRLKERGATA